AAGAPPRRPRGDRSGRRGIESARRRRGAGARWVAQPPGIPRPRALADPLHSRPRRGGSMTRESTTRWTRWTRWLGIGAIGVALAACADVGDVRGDDPGGDGADDGAGAGDGDGAR